MKILFFEIVLMLRLELTLYVELESCDWKSILEEFSLY